MIESVLSDVHRSCFSGRVLLLFQFEDHATYSFEVYKQKPETVSKLRFD